MSGVVVYGRPRYPEGTKLSTKLCYPKTLHWYKNTSRAITLPSWRVIRQNLAIFGYSWAFFFTFFGCHSHKYAYLWNPSHRHNPKTYTKLFWCSFEHCHSPMMCTGGVQNGPLGPKKGQTWQACQCPNVTQKGPKWFQRIKIIFFWLFGTLFLMSNGQNCFQTTFICLRSIPVQWIPKLSRFMAVTTKKATEKAQKWAKWQDFGQKRA